MESRRKPTPNDVRWRFSRKWTPADRLRLVRLLVCRLGDQIRAQGGRYTGQEIPNLTAIAESTVATAAELEACRRDIRRMVQDEAARWRKVKWRRAKR